MRLHIRRNLFATVSMIVGGLSLAAMPLTAGFPSRWALLQMLAGIYPNYAIVLLVAGLCAWMGYIRVIAETVDLTGIIDGDMYRTTSESRGTIGLSVFVVLSLIIFGLVPQWLYPKAASMFEHIAMILV